MLQTKVLKPIKRQTVLHFFRPHFNTLAKLSAEIATIRKHLYFEVSCPTKLLKICRLQLTQNCIIYHAYRKRCVSI